MGGQHCIVLPTLIEMYDEFRNTAVFSWCFLISCNYSIIYDMVGQSLDTLRKKTWLGRSSELGARGELLGLQPFDENKNNKHIEGSKQFGVCYDVWDRTEPLILAGLF